MVALDADFLQLTQYLKVGFTANKLGHTYNLFSALQLTQYLKVGFTLKRNIRILAINPVPQGRFHPLSGLLLTLAASWTCN